ncbi:MAG: hypothetical protein LC793_12860 [Thermomicrobia bacterium]|nr:hypothetical protein [Thermomicrobia bacterium]
MDRVPAPPQPPRDNAPPEAHEPQGSDAIDVERLADLVYRLAREEARLARARGERPGR